jgi:hypothetical protein
MNAWWMTIAIAHIILTVIPLILLRNRLTNRLDSIPVGSLEITLVSVGLQFSVCIQQE